MGKIIPDGIWVVISPVTEARKVKVGDIILGRTSQGIGLHLVKDIQIKAQRYLVGPVMGRNNEWVGLEEIFGRRPKDGEGLDIPLRRN